MYCCTMGNIYATIKLQVLPNLLTPASIMKIVPHSTFETGLFISNAKVAYQTSFRKFHLLRTF
jgi:hypothetical protein